MRGDDMGRNRHKFKNLTSDTTNLQRPRAPSKRKHSSVILANRHSITNIQKNKLPDTLVSHLELLRKLFEEKKIKFAVAGIESDRIVIHINGILGKGLTGLNKKNSTYHS